MDQMPSVSYSKDSASTIREHVHDSGGTSKRRSHNWSAGGLAALVFVCGFGALNLFWFLGSWPHDVLGLWDFRSATLGDGLLLPTAAAILVLGITNFQPATHERMVAGLCAAVGAAGGLLQQIAFVTDKRIVPN